MSTAVVTVTGTTGTTGKLTIDGLFDHTFHADFMKATDQLVSHPTVRNIVIDFEKVSLIDSLGVGMLVVFKDRAQGEGGTVALRNCGADVRRILEIAGLRKEFAIH
ncbi:STAS domain-containing protein [Streptomyces sp. P6-2-1]|uniref:STAS domain-containing protein n=1 Tax=Streptomyces sp. P6-2-1 TaxID=3422591 RepID=UPI003D364F31